MTNGTKYKTFRSLYCPFPSMKYQAIEEDYDLGRPVGFGATEAEAISDLMMQLALECNANGNARRLEDDGAASLHVGDV